MASRITSLSNESLDIDMLQAKLDLYESSTQALRKEIPLYFQRYAEKIRPYNSLANVVKNVASCESDEGLQRALFQAALSYENIDAHASLLPDKEQQLIALTEELKSLALTPFREILVDTIATKQTLADETLQAHYDRSLYVNHALFEVHRARYLRAAVASQVHAELRFHCAAVQELSAALQALNAVAK